MPSTFLESKNYSTDCCARQARDAQNEQMANWRLYKELHVDCETPKIRSPDFQYDHVNLRAGIGYGVSGGCEIDQDSKLRVNPSGMTTDKCKVQLYSRLFQGVPNLKPVVDDHGKELAILEGVSTTCGSGFMYKKHLMELDLSHRTPLVDCMKDIQNAEHIVPDWTRGGDPTRDFVRRKNFMNRCQ